jgi:putative Holliday junction resolvase
MPRLLAIDYGEARTGVAVSDETGTLARPLAIVERVESAAGLAELCAIIDHEQPDEVVVGLPLTLRGERGAQAQATEAFVERLRRRCTIPILTEDERYTTTIARRTRTTGRSRRTPDDARAAAILLQGLLDRRAAAAAEPRS